MSSEWFQTTVGEFCPFIYGKALPERARVPGEYPVVSSAGVTGCHNTPLTKCGGIVIGRKGTVGSVTLCVQPFWPIDTAYYVLDEPDKRDLYFTYYLLGAIGLSGMNSDSAVPGLNRDNAHALSITVPFLNVQKRISAILRTLDDRIALLRETNATLEAIAQALFKSWFVDFDPVHANAATLENKEQASSLPLEIQTLFPATFTDSPQGPIPEGWQICSVEDIAERVGMGPFGSNIKVSTFVESGIPVISGQHLKNYLVEDNSFNFVTEEHAQKLAKSCVHAGDVIFTHAGSIGQVSLLHSDSRYKKYVLSQRQFFLRCDPEKMAPEWMTYYFKSPSGQHQLLANTSQVGVPSIARPVSYLRSIQFVKPPIEIVSRFAEIVDALNSKTMGLRQQLNNLTQIRDTLLPRLISGQLRLPEAEQAMAAITD